MSIILSILFYGAILAFILSRSNKNNQQNKSHNQKTSYNVVTDYNKKKSTVSKNAKAGKRKAGANDEYDEVSLSYCESTIKPSSGITFRGVKEGTDELEILERRNAARERELERALHNEHSH